MSLAVFLAVMAAALLHAAWNAAIRGAHDRTTSMAAVVVGQALFGAVLVAVLPFPARESWPWIAVGAALHLGYQFFLLAAYRAGGLSEVYPLARGTAPLLVAGVSVGLLGVSLGAMEWGGIALVSMGIVSAALLGTGGALARPSRAAGMALATSAFIAAYSLADGWGARLSGAPVAFYAWLAMVNALALLLILPLWRPAALRALPRAKRMTVLGGGASFAAYALVVWAFTRAPIATVAALRETSIVFALAIGIFLLGERADPRRILGAALTLAGAMLLRLGGG